MSQAHPRNLKQLISLTLLLMLSMLALCACAPAEPSAEDHAATERAAPSPAGDTALNALQQEMRLLDEAVRTSITAIANNTPQVALASIHRVHDARKQTEAWLHSGQYLLLADHDSLTAFAVMDGAFHEQLERFAGSLEAGSLDEAAAALGPLTQSCVACHARFRYRDAAARRDAATK